MVSELVSKYIWLIGQFVKAGEKGLTLSQIQDRWEYRWGTPYPRRSFNNHREAIAEIFSVDIECDRSRNTYHIAALDEVTDAGSASSWLINTFTVNNLLSMGKERLLGRVSVENIPSGQKWLTTLMDAMLSGEEILLEYRKSTSDASEPLHVRPYALKEFEKRWYLIGHCLERGAIRMYGLDRIQSIVLEGKTFTMPSGFDVDALFAGSFGSYLPREGQKAEEICLRATPREARYLRDLPLHRTQEETDGSEGTPERPVVFRYRMIPDDNLVLELCRHGDRIEILRPASLAARVAREHARASALYAKTNSNPI